MCFPTLDSEVNTGFTVDYYEPTVKFDSHDFRVQKRRSDDYKLRKLYLLVLH